MKGSLQIYNFLLVIVVSLTLGGCKHRELIDIGNTHYVRVYINESIPNVTQGFYDAALDHPKQKLPTVMRVMLCNPQDGRVVSERYLQHSARDSRGYYLDGYVIAPPGNYQLMLYNFGTETTQLHAENNYYKLEGYTYEISDMVASKLPQSKAEFEGQPIVYDPDHLYVQHRENITIKPRGDVDTLYTANGDFFEAETLVKSFYVQVRIKGIQWVKSSVSLLSGMSRKVRLHDGRLNEKEPSILFFEMKAGHRSDVLYSEGEVHRNPSVNMNEPQTAVLYSTFNTFGKLPHTTSTFRVTFEFVRVDGKSQVETMDITPLFDTPEAKENQWLLIDKEIEIEKPEPSEGGGFEPGVEDWEDENTDIII